MEGRERRAETSPVKPGVGTAPGVISEQEIYRLDEAVARLGWSQSALRSARRRGLRVLRSGKRAYLSGREIVRFLEADNVSFDDPQPNSTGMNSRSSKSVGHRSSVSN